MSYYKTIRELYPEEKENYREIERPRQRETVKPQTNSRYTEKEYENTSEPDVFGRAFWFTLHNGASKYPVEPSPFQCEKMKGFIRGIPIMLPCEKCSIHAQTFIESNENSLDQIVSSRENLFEFFWNFHNYVNKRYGKREPSLEEIKSLFSGKVKVVELKNSLTNIIVKN